MRILVALAAAVFALAPAALRADPVADLRARVAPLTAKVPIKAAVELEVAQSSKEGSDSRNETAKITVLAEQRESGLSIEFPKELMDRARAEAEAAARDPEKETPVASAIGRVNAKSIEEALDCATTLMRDLDGARFVSETAGAFQGKPARLLTVAPKVALSKASKKHVKSINVELRLWLGADGLPVYSERKRTAKASFLLLSFDDNQLTRTVYGRKDDHLIALQRESEHSGSGLGQSYSGKDVLRVTVR
jgi:hypothetical protein